MVASNSFCTLAMAACSLTLSWWQPPRASRLPSRSAAPARWNRVVKRVMGISWVEPGNRRSVSLGGCATTARGRRDSGGRSGARQGHALLTLVLAAAVLVAGLALFVRLQEQHLRHALVGVDLGRQRRGVGELERHM